jgi:hypothetical protein
MTDVALTFAGLIAVGIKIMSVLKFVEAKDWLAFRNQVGAWLVGIVVVFWGANIQGISATEIGGIALGDMTLPTLAYIGLALGSTGSLVYDGLSSLDNNRTAKI